MKNIEIIFKKTNRKSETGLPKLNPVNLVYLTKILVLTICVLGGSSAFTQNSFYTFFGSGGDGTPNNPYRISTPADLVEFSEYVMRDTTHETRPQNSITYGKYFQMTNDIDMSNVPFIPTGVRPSGPPAYFCGNFNGNGFAIKNLCTELFWYVKRAVISNLTFDSTYSSYPLIGNTVVATTLAAWVIESTITNCVAKNCVLRGFDACGLIRHIKDGTVSNCHVTNSEITGNGFSFFIQNAQVINSSVTNSTLTGFKRDERYWKKVNGFAYYVYDNSLLSGCCVSNCNILGNDIAGFVYATLCTQIENCYAQASLHRWEAPTCVPNRLPPCSQEYVSGFITTQGPCDVYYDDDVPVYIYNTTVSNCYAACNITMGDSNYTHAGSFGFNAGGTYTNCYYLPQPQLYAFWEGSSPGVIGINQPDLKSANMVASPGVMDSSLNYQQPKKPWKSDCSINPINKGYPILSWQYLPASAATLAATDTSSSSATLNGIVHKNDNIIVEKGFQWRKFEDTAWITTIVSDTTNTISATLTGLTFNTLYEFKAFIRTNKAVRYGDTLTFFTLEGSTVTTLEAVDITKSSATIQGMVYEGTDEPLVKRGFQWRKTGDSAWITVLATGTNNISATLTGLTKSTSYEFFAYIITDATLTKYGDTLTFSTLDDPSNVITLEATNIMASSATLNGIVFENDEPILERGFEWRVEGISWRTVQLSDTNNIISYLFKGLKMNTLYEYKAYIITTLGSTYGDIVTFLTSDKCTISGKVTHNGNPFADVTISCTDGSLSATTDSIGNYSLQVNSFATLILTANFSSYTFLPPSYTCKNITYDITNLNFMTASIDIVETIHGAKLRIYPNPTDSKLIIENGELVIENIEIYDIYGREIINCQLSNDNSIDISHLASGMYFLKIGNKTVKIIKL